MQTNRLSHERLYSLFEVHHANNKKYYVRISQGAYKKQSAVKIYQSALLAPFLNSNCPERCLRVVGHHI